MGVWTRPRETTPPRADRPRMVAARVAFIPISQSASARDRAACSSGRISEDGRRWSKPSRMARAVRLEIHRRSTGFSTPAVCQM